jgi:DNA-binding IclR family transcriptional regulator
VDAETYGQYSLRVVRTALERLGAPATLEDIAQGFKGAKRERVQELLETLVSLGQCGQDAQGRYVG